MLSPNVWVMWSIDWLLCVSLLLQNCLVTQFCLNMGQWQQVCASQVYGGICKTYIIPSVFLFVCCRIWVLLFVYLVQSLLLFLLARSYCELKRCILLPREHHIIYTGLYSLPNCSYLLCHPLKFNKTQLFIVNHIQAASHSLTKTSLD